MREQEKTLPEEVFPMPIMISLRTPRKKDSRNRGTLTSTVDLFLLPRPEEAL